MSITGHNEFLKLIRQLKSKFQVSFEQIQAKRIKSWRQDESHKVLFITESDRISQSLIYPFYFYKNSIDKQVHTQYIEININKLSEISEKVLAGADVVFFQPWFNKGPYEIRNLIEKIRRTTKISTKVIFLDAYAPLDLRFADYIEELVDVYVKKQLFSDLGEYDSPSLGDTKLVEYYNKLYGLPDEKPTNFKVSESFKKKLVLMPSFFVSSQMLPYYYFNDRPKVKRKNINIHARLGCKGTPWYQKMREDALDKCSMKSSNSIITPDSINNTKYWQELYSSKICFSPFGYGEVCWRDFEAILSGAMLIKPDMSHIQMKPNVFIEGETYVPVKWDFTDLEEKIDFYLNNDAERERIVQAAYSSLHEYVKGQEFINLAQSLIGCSVRE